MSEETKTATQAAAVVNRPTDAERRRQSRMDRQRNRIEQAKLPGTTVFRPETPAVSYEIMHYLRGIDRGMAILSRNIFQNKNNFKNIEQAGKEAEALKETVKKAATHISELAGIKFEEYNPRR